LLAETADAQRVLAFHLSDQKQARLDELLERNREGTLTVEESTELDVYERFEHLVRLLKARVLQKRSS
jgi:Cdc6-like AAA superfamily ATPase